jgi:hypothetical protein
MPSRMGTASMDRKVLTMTSKGYEITDGWDIDYVKFNSKAKNVLYQKKTF